jgi:O-methyltransferase
MQRLTSLQCCVETVPADDILGDLIECGAWLRRGVQVRAVLAASQDDRRCVWLADSFVGVLARTPQCTKQING